ncbi:MAG TPA: kinase [Micromonosporaceae bacterium]|nr:kinase [Micromonosporaceae bacterium]
MPGVILYGPPASGKDTVTRHLVALDRRYVPYRRIKVGPGRTAGYRMMSSEEVAALYARSEIVYENHRYGSSYFVDRSELAKQLDEAIPVLHLGQREGVDAARRAFPAERWLVVSLWCSREVAAERIAARDTGDIADRLAAWDGTEPVTADLSIDTGNTSPDESARKIDQALQDRPRKP